MTIDENVLLAYVMGSLTPEEEAAVIAHLRQHPEDAAWVKTMFELRGEMAMTLDPVKPPTDAEAALLKRIRSTAATPADEASASQSTDVLRGPPKMAVPIWLTLAVAAAIALMIFLPQIRQFQLARQFAVLCQNEAVICQDILTDDGEFIAEVAQRPDNSLVVRFVADPPEGQVYQAWEIIEGIPQSLGVWDTALLEIPALAESSVFGVSIEPPAGSEQPTSPPILVYPLSSAG
jgi:anti-sigma-K factor RskA